MNVREYIESGILEMYVMGSLSREEMLEVEMFAKSSGEIRNELHHVENSLINYASANGMQPRPELRASILNRIEIEARSLQMKTSRNAETIVKPINGVVASSSSVYKYAAAASVALLLVSGLSNYTFWNKLKTAENEIAILNSNKEELAQQFNTVRNNYDRTIADVAVLRSTAFKTIVMKGLPTMDSTALAKVYWNTNTQEAFVDVSKMPTPAADKQYQLWALVDGKPVDAGVFNVGDSVTGLQKMKNVINAQAFAVTLEPKGGSVSPTLTAMYVLGNV